LPFHAEECACEVLAAQRVFFRAGILLIHDNEIILEKSPSRAKDDAG